ncbi:TPA: hypothetical protein V0S35_000502 [Streptococcus pneumoniae]|nr:hypothetical protein [Streptococcus pneumoniae]
MNPNLFRSVEFYQRRYHNYATVLIIPLSLLFTFILIFSLVATKEITVTSQGEIAPTSIISSIQSTSDNPILANHLVANQVVEKGDLLIKYSETMEESQKTALATQLQRLEKQKEGLGILKQSLEKATDLFSGEDEFGYHNTFMNFTKQSHDIELGITKTNTEVSNQANLANSSSSAIEQEITKVQQQIGEYQELRDAIINNRARLPTSNPHQSILNRYLVASQGQTVRLKLEKIGNHGITIIGQLQTIDQTPTRTEQGNLFKLTALAKLSNEDSKLIQYGLQGRVTSVTAKKTYFDYFKDKILTHSD